MIKACICGGQVERRPVVRGKTFQILRCASCTLLMTDPPPSGHFDDSYYSENYLARIDYWTERNRNCFEQYVVPHRSCGRVLDVGAGVGLFLRSLDGRAWERVGIDPSESACRIAKTRFGLDVRQLRLEDLPDDGGYDLITFWDVIQAVSDPLSTLRAARRHARQDTFLLIKAPLVDDRAIAAGKILSKVDKAGIIFQPKARSFHFNTTSLCRLIRSAGFKLQGLHKIPTHSIRIALTSTGRLRGRLAGLALHGTGIASTVVATARPG